MFQSNIDFFLEKMYCRIGKKAKCETFPVLEALGALNMIQSNTDLSSIEMVP